jgi:hypothetical protein
MVRDIAIGNVGSAVNAYSGHVRITWREREAHVRHQDSGEGKTLRRPEADLLHRLWSRISVDPECHGHERNLVSAVPRTRTAAGAPAGFVII